MTKKNLYIKQIRVLRGGVTLIGTKTSSSKTKNQFSAFCGIHWFSNVRRERIILVLQAIAIHVFIPNQCLIPDLIINKRSKYL